MKETYIESYRFSIELSREFSLYSAIWPLFFYISLKEHLLKNIDFLTYIKYRIQEVLPIEYKYVS